MDRSLKTLVICSVLAAVTVIPMIPAISPAQEKGGRVALSEELAGLAPAPRIAYLRHLIGGGRDEAEVFFQLAIAYHESSMPDSAICYYQRTVKKDPRHFKAYVNLGVLLDDQGKVPEAEMYFRSAVDIKPDDVLANSHLAFILFGQKSYDVAWEHLSRALEAAPGDPQPRFYLAIFFWECNMYREALAEWEKVIALAPGGFLAARARENIVMLQNALNSPAPSGEWNPRR